jgi:hypothetical protein
MQVKHALKSKFSYYLVSVIGLKDATIRDVGVQLWPAYTAASNIGRAVDECMLHVIAR